MGTRLVVAAVLNPDNTMPISNDQQTPFRKRASVPPKRRSGTAKSNPVKRKDVQPATAADLVYEHILEGLYRGQYAPGQRLIEADISERCGVSRGPIREAFRRLSAEGLLVHALNRGAYVRSLTVEEAQDTLVVVEALLRTTARLAAERIDEGDNRRKYEQSARAFLNYQQSGDLRAYIEARANLTAIMLDIAGNAELTRVVSAINMTLLRVHFIPFGGDFEQRRFGQYQAIVEAVLSGDSAAAMRAVSRHVRSVSQDVARVFGKERKLI